MAFFSILGLGLSLLNWELSFKERYSNNVDINAAAVTRNFLTGLVLLTTLLAFFALFLRDFCAIVWYEYRSPHQFYEHLEKSEKIRKGEIDDSNFMSTETLKHLKLVF